MSGSETRRPGRASGAGEPHPEPQAQRQPPARAGNGRYLPKQPARISEDPSPSPASAPRKARGKTKAKKAARWSAARQKAFLAALAETAHIAHSARAAKISETTVYRKRRESEDFRVLWEAALREGVARLEVTLLHRALYGVEETQWYGGKQVGTEIKFNDRLALAIVTARRTKDAANDMADPEPRPSTDELRAQLKAKLSEMNRRMGGAG